MGEEEVPWTLGGTEKGLKHQRLIKRPETKGEGACELEPHVLSGGATVQVGGWHSQLRVSASAFPGRPLQWFVFTVNQTSFKITMETHLWVCL